MTRPVRSPNPASPVAVVGDRSGTGEPPLPLKEVSFGAPRTVLAPTGVLFKAPSARPTFPPVRFGNRATPTVPSRPPEGPPVVSYPPQVTPAADTVPRTTGAVKDNPPGVSLGPRGRTGEPVKIPSLAEAMSRDRPGGSPVTDRPVTSRSDLLRIGMT